MGALDDWYLQGPGLGWKVRLDFSLPSCKLSLNMLLTPLRSLLTSNLPWTWGRRRPNQLEGGHAAGQPLLIPFT